MKVYVGFDLGTTNTKALVISGDGNVVEIIKEKTPNLIVSGIEYFDLALVEKTVDDMVSSLMTRYELAGMAFTSIGESVVPVKNGKMAHLPLMWRETVTSELGESIRGEIEKLTDYGKTGVANDFRFSLYKILWMKKNLDLGDVDFWLPISSFLAYRFTGNAVWAESQACRSYLYDIHTRQWNDSVLDFAGIHGKTGSIAYTGTLAGRWGNVAVGVAGHDHITGLYGVYTLSGGAGSIFYDSMGTSSVLGSIVQEKSGELHLHEPFFNGRTGVLGSAYTDGQYYIQNSFRYFGILLEKIAHLTGGNADAAYYDALNGEIAALPSAVPQAMFSVGGDCILGAQRNKVNILNFTLDISRAELMQSAYVYLCAMTRIILEGLRTYCEDGPYYAGGGIVGDETFMRYKASMIQKPITVYDTEELTALGAAVAAVTAAGDSSTLGAARIGLHKRQIQPDETIVKDLDVAYWRYCELRQSPAIGYFQ
jgi:sugar (pentulose or hexulose) kinase